MALLCSAGGCAILKFDLTNYFFLAAGFLAVFLAGALAAGFFFSGTDTHLRSIWGLFFAPNSRDFLRD